MKKNRLIWISLSLILALFVMYCFSHYKNHQFEKIETITINPKKSINERLYITIKSITPLETSDSTLIGDVTTLKSYKGKYYLFDKYFSKTLFLFDASGKFLNKIKIGKGPGEMIQPWDFCINETNKTILVWDQMTFNLNIYDLNLSYIESIKCPKMAIRNISYLGNNSFLIFSQFFPIDNGQIIERVLYDYFVYSDNFKTFVKKIHKSDPKTRLISIDNAISNTEKKFFIAPIDNNIYELSKDYLTKPIIKFDFGKFQITDDDLVKGYKYYRPEIQKGNRVGPLSDLFLNDNYISVSFSFKGKELYFIYNRNKHDGFISVDPILEKQIPPCTIKGLLADNTFIGVVNAMDFKKFIETNKIEKFDTTLIGDFSNQIILKFSVN